MTPKWLRLLMAGLIILITIFGTMFIISFLWVVTFTSSEEFNLPLFIICFLAMPPLLLLARWANKVWRT